MVNFDLSSIRSTYRHIGHFFIMEFKRFEYLRTYKSRNINISL